MAIRFRRYISVLVSLLLVGPSFGAQVKSLTENETVKGNISNTDLNRISVEGDRIAQVFGSSGHFTMETDETHGQIFIRPVGEGRQLSLTIITESGLTQDILLIPSNIPSQSIVLKPAKRNAEQAKHWETSQPYVQTITSLMQAMVQGKEVPGFNLRVNEQSLNMWNDLHVKQLQIFEGSQLKGVTYELKNNGDKALGLQEKQFLFDRDIVAISLERFNLAPGGRAYLWVIKHA